ncbi:glycosyltransferase [Providencia rettgeri]|uniref:glycosyltransferase n=1 Tax=Providencia rettgeri TaxID=587 RepID=UPI00301952E9
MKNIFLLIDDITTTGGTERVACTLSSSLCQLGYNVTIHTLNFTKESIHFKINNEVKIENYENINRFHAIYQIIKKSKLVNTPIIVISMGKLSVDVALVSIFCKPNKLIFSEHISYESFGFIKRKIKKTAYKLASKVIFLTENDCNILTKHTHDDNKFDFIRNINPYYDSGTSISQFNDRQNIALAVGRLSYQKNFSALIDIWSKIDSTNWKLLIIGDGEEKNKLIKLSKGISNIEIIPATKKIDTYYNKAKVFLMTSRYEGLPMVLIESQYFGIPAIAYDCKTGPREIIINNRTGYIISNNDKETFTKKLNFLLQNNEELNRMHINSIKNHGEYSPDSILKKWIRIIEA